MSSRRESINAQNIAGFRLIIDFLLALGSEYQPSDNAISIFSLENDLQTVITTEDGFNKLQATFCQALYDQQAAFEQAAKLMEQVELVPNPLRSADKTSEAHKMLIKKVKGGREIKMVLVKDGQSVGNYTLSVSQFHYANRATSLHLVIQTLKTEEGYSPSDASISIAGLKSKLKAMNDSCEGIASLMASVEEMRLLRNNILYHPETGLINIVRMIKAYIRNLYGQQSEQYQRLLVIPFSHKKF